MFGANGSQYLTSIDHAVFDHQLLPSFNFAEEGTEFLLLYVGSCHLKRHKSTWNERLHEFIFFGRARCENVVGLWSPIHILYAFLCNLAYCGSGLILKFMKAVVSFVLFDS